jgi:hypothetical protein
MNSIRDKLGDKMDTNIQRPRKPRIKIHNIPEEITTDNIEDTLIAQNPDIGIDKGEITPKFTYETKRHSQHSNRGQFPN